MTVRLNDEQQLAAQHLGGRVLVTAGAGSGKTRMLTERFANAVVSGRLPGWLPVDPGGVLAITYTEKAAGEIAERVRAEIEDSGDGQLGLNEDLWISTIHGFCARVLKRDPFEAGVDPLFTVVDTLEAGRLREQAFRDALAQLDHSDERLRELLDTYPADAVFEAVLAIERQLAVTGLDARAISLEPIHSVIQLLDEAEKLFSDGATTCDIDYNGTSTGHLDHAEQCRELLSACSEIATLDHSEQATFARLLGIAESYTPIKKLKGFEELSDEFASRKAAFAAHAAATMVRSHAEELRELVIAYGRRFRELKQQFGALDFEDLQTKAAELLDQQPAVAARYRERFRVVMIDEFQDTDALQLRLLEQVAGENLCTVGDEMQSIYGFRGADVEVYREHRESMKQQGALVAELATNYRSHPEILGFINGVFASEQYAKNRTLPLKPAPGGRGGQPLDEVLDARPRVEVCFVDTGVENVASGRAREAAHVAERLAELQSRGLNPGDVAVLVRAYTDAHIYADALADWGLPATIVGGGRFFSLPETATMRALTKVLANTGDETALGMLLVSDFIPIGDEALLRLRLAAQGERRSLWEVICVAAPALAAVDVEALVRLREVVERAQARVGREPLTDVLLRAVEEAGYDLRLLAVGNKGRDAFANVLKFARRAADFEQREGSGPAGFSAHLDAKERLGDREAPDSAVDEGASAVQIMSIHAAKGLEFPVVVVPDIGRGNRGNRGIVRMERLAGELRFALKTPAHDESGKPRACTEWFGAFDAADKAAQEEERDRVLYVALTRARDLLMVSGSGRLNPAKRSESNDDLVKLARVLGHDVPIGQPRDEAIAFEGMTVGHLTILGPAASAAENAHQDLVAEDVPPPPFGLPLHNPPSRAWHPDMVSYTQLSEFERCPRQFRIRRILGIAPPDSSTAAARPMRLGNALHAALRLVSDSGTPPAAERMCALTRYFELDASESARLSEATSRYCESEIAKRAAEADFVMREAPFSVAVAGDLFVLGGSIDLFARNGSGALIIDYKSGVSGTQEELLNRYRLQAECYAFAALRGGSDRAEVVFVRPEVSRDGQVEQAGFRFDSDDAGRIEARLVGEYQSVRNSAFDPTPGSACANCEVPRGMCEHRV
jgi:ATP-dependent exoDNAse (exonuclease V) beta subunit